MTANRSFLFAPGNHARKVEKAFTAGADAVIPDLEDAVAAFAEAAAKGSASTQLDGYFIDYPVVYQAQRILRLIETRPASETGLITAPGLYP